MTLTLAAVPAITGLGNPETITVRASAATTEIPAWMPVSFVSAPADSDQSDVDVIVCAAHIAEHFRRTAHELNCRAYANGGFDEVSSIKFDPHRIFSEV